MAANPNKESTAGQAVVGLNGMVNKKGAAKRCPFYTLHPHGMSFDLVQTLDQVWLSIVRSVV